MTYNTTVPNAGQSPGLFPAQNNTNFSRLKTIIDADHNFLDTAADAQGAHNQVTFIDRADPSSLLTGTDSIIYGKTASDGASELWFYEGSVNNQVNWRELSGTVAISSTSTYANIATVPANAFGTVFMWPTTGSTLYVQQGGFVSNATTCFGWSSGTYDNSTASTLPQIGLAGGVLTSGLNLRGVRVVAPSLTWNYRIYYRLQ